MLYVTRPRARVNIHTRGIVKLLSSNYHIYNFFYVLAKSKEIDINIHGSLSEFDEGMIESNLDLHAFFSGRTTESKLF